jgi:CRISPR/Cas system-associated protein Cas10 (large subunit of type III CRISPR-Cas system)
MVVTKLLLIKRKAKNFEQLTGIEREDNENDNSPIIKSECTGSFNRLAILRMDVDLGQIFIKGFNKETASFSAYATLSGQLVF